MGGSFEQEEIVWRKKGQQISKLTADEIKKIINGKFKILQQNLGDDYGRSGYSCTLYETERANINYFHFLNDKELDKLKDWIFYYSRIILDDINFANNFSRKHNVDSRSLRNDSIWAWYVLDEQYNKYGYSNRWNSRYRSPPDIGSMDVYKFSEEIVKAFNKWEKKLGKRDKAIIEKLKENNFDMTKQGFHLFLAANDKGGDAVGLANDNKVYFGSMVSC
jgi:hypothetical protein